MKEFFLDKNSPPLILDGAMGSLLSERLTNSKEYSSLWSSGYNFSHPNEVIKLHKEYISAGADIITTNTFRTNPISMRKSDIKTDSRNAVTIAVELAKSASLNTKAIIAGCNPPAEDCYQIKRTVSYSELRENHTNHIELLMNAGSDLILNETQSHLDEIQIVTDFCQDHSIPYIISFFIDDNLQILSGEHISYVLRYVLNKSPLAIGFNCIKPSTFLLLLQLNEILDILKVSNWGFHLNCGSGNFTDKNIGCSIEPVEYKNFIRNAAEFFPSYVGACCGSTPLHIKMIRRFFYEKDNY